MQILTLLGNFKYKFFPVSTHSSSPHQRLYSSLCRAVGILLPVWMLGKAFSHTLWRVWDREHKIHMKSCTSVTLVLACVFLSWSWLQRYPTLPAEDIAALQDSPGMMSMWQHAIKSCSWAGLRCSPLNSSFLRTLYPDTPVLAANLGFKSFSAMLIICGRIYMRSQVIASNMVFQWSDIKSHIRNRMKNVMGLYP